MMSHGTWGGFAPPPPLLLAVSRRLTQVWMGGGTKTKPLFINRSPYYPQGSWSYSTGGTSKVPASRVTSLVRVTRTPGEISITGKLMRLQQQAQARPRGSLHGCCRPSRKTRGTGEIMSAELVPMIKKTGDAQEDV